MIGLDSKLRGHIHAYLAQVERIAHGRIIRRSGSAAYASAIGAVDQRAYMRAAIGVTSARRETHRYTHRTVRRHRVVAVPAYRADIERITARSSDGTIHVVRAMAARPLPPYTFQMQGDVRIAVRQGDIPSRFDPRHLAAIVVAFAVLEMPTASVFPWDYIWRLAKRIVEPRTGPVQSAAITAVATAQMADIILGSVTHADIDAQTIVVVAVVIETLIIAVAVIDDGLPRDVRIAAVVIVLQTVAVVAIAPLGTPERIVMVEIFPFHPCFGGLWYHHKHHSRDDS